MSIFHSEIISLALKHISFSRFFFLSFLNFPFASYPRLQTVGQNCCFLWRFASSRYSLFRSNQPLAFGHSYMPSAFSEDPKAFFRGRTGTIIRSIYPPRFEVAWARLLLMIDLNVSEIGCMVVFRLLSVITKFCR